MFQNLVANKYIESVHNGKQITEIFHRVDIWTHNLLGKGEWLFMEFFYCKDLPPFLLFCAIHLYALAWKN